MRNINRRSIVQLGVGAFALSSLGVRAQASTLALGVILPQSGPASQFAGPIEAGMNAAQKQINDTGGIGGRRLELVFRDSGTNPQRALLAARELVEERKVDILFPEIVSGLALAVLPYTTEKKVLTITNGSAPKIGDAKEFPYSFQLGDLASKRAPAMAAALQKLGGKKVGILVSTNPGNIATGEGLKVEIPRRGMEVATYRTFSPDAKDLNANIQALRDAGADIVAFDTVPRESIRTMMTGMQTLDWRAKVVSGVASLSGDLIEIVPAPVRSQFHALNYRIGTRTGPIQPELQKFLVELRKAGPITNLAFNVIARDIVYTVKWGAERASRMPGGATADNIKRAFEGVGNSDFAAQSSLVLGNPGWTASDHTTSNVKYSSLWALVRPSTPVDGMYEGEELNFTE
jgi:branched-chain amino acid transport system substrate-binding protein